MKKTIFCLIICLTLAAPALADVEIDVGVKEDMQERQNAARQKARESGPQMEMAETSNLNEAETYEIVSPEQKRTRIVVEGTQTRVENDFDAARLAKIKAVMEEIPLTEFAGVKWYGHRRANEKVYVEGDPLAFAEKYFEKQSRNRRWLRETYCGPDAKAAEAYNMNVNQADCAKLTAELREFELDLATVAADGVVTGHELAAIDRIEDPFYEYLSKEFTSVCGAWVTEADPRFTPAYRARKCGETQVVSQAPSNKSYGIVGKAKSASRRPASATGKGKSKAAR